MILCVWAAYKIANGEWKRYPGGRFVFAGVVQYTHAYNHKPEGRQIHIVRATKRVKSYLRVLAYNI